MKECCQKVAEFVKLMNAEDYILLTRDGQHITSHINGDALSLAGLLDEFFSAYPAIGVALNLILASRANGRSEN